MMAAYWLLVNHGRFPGEYRRLPAGERELIRIILGHHLNNKNRK